MPRKNKLSDEPNILPYATPPLRRTRWVVFNALWAVVSLFLAIYAWILFCYGVAMIWFVIIGSADGVLGFLFLGGALCTIGAVWGTILLWAFVSAIRFLRGTP